MNEREKLFATAKTFPLIVKFSIPTIIGMLVTSLNVLIDRIFVGNIENGDLAIAGVTVSMPIVILIFATAMLAGAGGAANVSLNLGAGRHDRARNFMGNGVIIALLTSVIVSAAILLAGDSILSLFGASETVMPYARPYLQVSVACSIFNSMLFTLNQYMLSQGMPMYSMISNVFCVGINVILDPVFLFVFKMGIAGAAWATAIAQLAGVVLVLTFYMRGKCSVRPSKSDYKLKREYVAGILKIGSAPALLQFLISIVNLVLNRSLLTYGGDVAISAMGIVISIQQVTMMPIFGINQGIQPIIGFNYGAKLFSRVRKFLLQGILFATCVITFIWGIMMIFTWEITGLFGATGELQELAVRSFRTFMACMPIVAIQVIGSNYFQSVGKPIYSLLLTTSRQALLLIPLMLILPQFFGLTGVIMSGCVSDFISAIICAFFIIREVRSLKQKELSLGLKQEPLVEI